MVKRLLLVIYTVYAIERKVVHFVTPVVGCALDWRKERKAKQAYTIQINQWWG